MCGSLSPYRRTQPFETSLEMIRDTANKLMETFYGVLPYETAVHLANAQKEFLKAVESMIEEQIKWTDIHVERAHSNKDTHYPRITLITRIFLIVISVI